MIHHNYLLLLAVVSAYGAPDNPIEQKKALVPRQVKAINNDLKTASSSYSHQYSDWGGSYPGGYGFSVTGYGTIDDKSRFDPSSNILGGYDSPIKTSFTGYGNTGYGNTGYGNTGYGNTGYGYGSNVDYGGYKGYGGGYAPSGFSPSGYGSSGLASSGGYFSNAGYGVGNGGYGGYGGNGGLNSYYGYNNPNYQGAGHLGYGYYNKKPGYGNIYNSGVAPSLVTGYRGYTRR